MILQKAKAVMTAAFVLLSLMLRNINLIFVKMVHM